MKHYLITTPDGIDAISFTESETPKPGPNQVLVKIHANSLNFRDLIIPMGGYPRNDTLPMIPLSDGAGEVVEVGSEVTEFKTGDRVMGNFFQNWIKGELKDAEVGSALGGSINGTLAEYAVFNADATLRVPEHLSYLEAATLPCAAVTAWNALQSANLKAGDTVLLLGTGGVSIFGLQLAKAQGANVIITSSSDEKLEKAKSLGADHLINYRQTPEWSEKVMEITDGHGVDNVLEVGGEATLSHSIASTRIGGTISLIGIVTGLEMELSNLLFLRNQTMRGILVGSTEMFQAMNKAIIQNKIRPVISSTFGFDEAKDALGHLAGASHVGKVVIAHS